jgi:hypothetical protein
MHGVTVICSNINPRAVANLKDPAAVLLFKETAFFNNNHSNVVSCYHLSPDPDPVVQWQDCYETKMAQV